MLRRADSQVAAIKHRTATPASSSTASLLMVAFFSIEFDLKMIHMEEKADVYRLRSDLYTHKKKITTVLPVLLHSEWLLPDYLP